MTHNSIRQADCLTAYMKYISTTSIKFLTVASLTVALSGGYLLQSVLSNLTVSAAAFTNATVRLDRMKASQATTVRVLIKPATMATEAKVKIEFPDFTIGSPTVSTAGNLTVDSATALPGTLSASNAGTAITVTGVTDLTVGTLYGFDITAGVTNPAATGATTMTVSTLTSGDAVIDSSVVDSQIISDDQIVVNASVGATFTFALSANSASLGALSDSAVAASTPITATVTTNAASGWYLWARDANNNGSGRGSLHSTANGHNIAGTAAPSASSRTISSGSEDYGMGATVTHDGGTGTPSVTSAYDGSSSKVGTLDPTGYRPISSSNGTATGSGDVTSLVFRAAISNSTPPATDYSDTITVVAAGSF